MALVLVTGPAGLLGSALIPRLITRGHQVRVLVHKTPVPPSWPVEVVLGDVCTGDGLLDATARVDAVIHTATSAFRKMKETDFDGTAHLQRAADLVRAHFIYPSIVGVDRLGGPYNRVKRMAESQVETGRRWTIVRATQFHPFIDRMLALPVLPVTDHLAFQPVDVGDLADHLVGLVEVDPKGRAADFGGPQILPLRHLAATRSATSGGRAARLVRVPALGPLRGYDAGRNLCPASARGQVTWQTWLDLNRG